MHPETCTIRWVLDKIRTDYADDIAIAVVHNETALSEHDHFGFFVPATPRGQRLARTYILEGVGTDVWGVSWERLERFAALEEYYIGVLPDARVIYARTEADRARFEELQKRCLANLADPVCSRRAALGSFETAKAICGDLLMARDDADRRGTAAYVIDFLARAVAFANHTYFHQAQMDQLTELARMERLPEGFAEHYRAIIHAPDPAQLPQLCREIVWRTADFLEGEAHDLLHPEHNFQDLADWYAELAFTWQRIRHFSAVGKPESAFMSAVMLQRELGEVCTDFDLPQMPLLDAWDADAPAALVARADALEQQMRRIITDHGGVIHEYASCEELLREV